MTRLLLDVKGSRATPGERVIATKEDDKDTQLFWSDFVTGTIRTKVNDLCLDVYGKKPMNI